MCGFKYETPFLICLLWLILICESVNDRNGVNLLNLIQSKSIIDERIVTSYPSICKVSFGPLDLKFRHIVLRHLLIA